MARSEYIIGVIAIVAFILSAVYLPQMVQTGENATKEILPHEEPVPQPVKIVKEKVYVPSSIPLENSTETYGDVRMLKMVEAITHNARIETKGLGRAATQQELAEFSAAFDNSEIENRAARGIAAISDVFLKKTNVWVGHFSTNKDRVFILVLVRVADSPTFLKIDVLSSDPETRTKVWQAEDEDTADTVAGEARQVFLCAGRMIKHPFYAGIQGALFLSASQNRAKIPMSRFRYI